MNLTLHEFNSTLYMNLTIAYGVTPFRSFVIDAYHEENEQETDLCFPDSDQCITAPST